LQRLRFADFLRRGGEIVHVDEHAEEADVRHGKLWIEAQRLIERACGVDPDIIVQAGHALIVESLCFREAGCYVIIDVADVIPKRDGELQDVARNIANGAVHVGAMVVRRWNG
jgi:hypothetical protein